jgi:hypothetical protein
LWVTNGYADNMIGTSEVPQVADPLCATRKSAALGQKETYAGEPKTCIDHLISSAWANEVVMDPSSVSLSSQRLLLKSFTGDDARKAFLVATPTIARFMSWEPAPSLEAFERICQSLILKMRAGTDVSLTVRHKPSLEFLGIAGLQNTDAIEPEFGIWIKEFQHGYGYGREAVATIEHSSPALG